MSTSMRINSQQKRMRTRIRQSRSHCWRGLPPRAWLFLLLMLLSQLSSGPSSSSSSLLPFCVAAPAPSIDEKKKKRRKNLQTTPTFAIKKKASSVDAADKTMTMNQILIKAGKRGLGGGLPGAVAGVVQVTTLMWLRTIINYQCRYGTTFRQAFTTLFHDGGIPRFYRGTELCSGTGSNVTICRHGCQ